MELMPFRTGLVGSETLNYKIRYEYKNHEIKAYSSLLSHLYHIVFNHKNSKSTIVKYYIIHEVIGY